MTETHPADIDSTTKSSTASKDPFFRTVDWLAFGTTFLFTLGAYYITLAPTVTLEDSGELAVASDYLGVPHPPGYPIWSLVTWFFQWIFNFVSYNGHPNPAWGVAFASAFFGAGACGILAMLVSRSGSSILHGVKHQSSILGRHSENIISWVCGVSGGLLFAFSSVLWSQSTIVEVYSLNAFFLCLILLLTYRWMCRPEEDAILYATAFIFGLGLTNHQSLVFLIFGLLSAIWYRNRPLFRDFMSIVFLVAAGALLYQAATIDINTAHPDPTAIRSRMHNLLLGITCLLAPGGLFLIERRLFSEWKRILLVIVLVALGVSFYAYMPFSSEQNPPINWGYPRTMEGFKHAISRGQYEKISPLQNLEHALLHPMHFAKLVWTIMFNPRDYISVVSQFLWIRKGNPLSWLTLLVPLSALIPFITAFFTDRKDRGWLISTLWTFFSMTVIFIIFQYPPLDIQTLFIGRVQYIQAHAIFALWISYGIAFTLAWLDGLLGGKRVLTIGLAAVALLLPAIPLARNAYDDEFINLVGACDQNGHDFGWQFGNWELQGVEGIEADFRAELSPEEFEKEWAEYPTPGYPAPMGTNAVFYGGTDPGRFVPTYMIYSAHVRSDVYLITQNALADNTYMNVMRDLYGDDIWIPSQQDSNFAFQQYVQDVQSGRIKAGAEVVIKDGRVSVQGVQGVMLINGILAKMIFEANKYNQEPDIEAALAEGVDPAELGIRMSQVGDRKRPVREFYVEESYVIPWMYPYLEPHGLIMKLNPEPLPQLDPKVVENDSKFWAWYVKRLMGNKAFHRDVVARKTFSKLRSALAGLYTARNMYDQAEVAFRQAIELYPLSPEANFRLADVFMRRGHFEEAEKLISEFLEKDTENEKVRDFLNQIRGSREANTRRIELETKYRSGQAGLNEVLELAELYRRMGQMPQFEQLTRSLLANTNLPPEVCLSLVEMFKNAQRADLMVNAYQVYLQRKPNEPRVWLELAGAEVAIGRNDQALQALERSIQLGGEAVRDLARRDPRLNNLRNDPRFIKLVPSIQPSTFLPMGGTRPANQRNLFTP